MTKFIPLILFTVFTNFLSQIMLKKGMTTIGHFEMSMSGLMSIVNDVLFNWHITGGIIVMVISMTAWLVVLSRAEISFAYPFLGISFVMITAYGYFVLGEAVTLWRVAGVLFICCGVTLIART